MIHDPQVIDEATELFRLADERLPGWVRFESDQALKLRKAAHWLQKGHASPLPADMRKAPVFEWAGQDGTWVGRLDKAEVSVDDNGVGWVSGRFRLRQPQKAKKEQS